MKCVDILGLFKIALSGNLYFCQFIYKHKIGGGDNVISEFQICSRIWIEVGAKYIYFLGLNYLLEDLN